MIRTIERIRTNKIKCRKCGDIIESIDVHDFKWCSCGAVAVDGGREYLRRVGNKNDFEELYNEDGMYIYKVTKGN